jgi:hypothetical protein
MSDQYSYVDQASIEAYSPVPDTKLPLSLKDRGSALLTLSADFWVARFALESFFRGVLC